MVGGAQTCATLAMRANIHRWNSNSDGSFICRAVLPPNSGLIIRIIVLIPRQSFASPLSFRSRESITLYTCELPPPWTVTVDPSTSLPLSLVSVHSDSHLHLRSFPALSLCSRPFSRSPAPRTDLTIPRVGNYVATGETREFASSVFLSLVSTLAPDPFATTKSRGYFRSVPWLNFHRRTVRPLDRARRFRSSFHLMLLVPSIDRVD